MRASNLFGNSGESPVNSAVILECIFSENHDMIFFAVPFTDEPLAIFKRVFIDGFLDFALNQPIDLVLHPYRESSLFFLLQKICNLIDDNIIAL